MICTASRSPSARSVLPSSGCGTTSRATRAASRRATSPSGRRGARGVERQQLEQLLEVGQPAQRLAREQLARDDAALVEDAAEQSRPRSPLCGRSVPGEQAIDQRLVAARRRRGQIGQRRARRTASARRAGAWPDRADRRSRAGGRGPGAPRRSRRDPPGGEDRRDRRARPSASGDASADSLRVRVSDEDLARVGDLARASSAAISPAIALRQPLAHHAHRQLAPRRRPPRGAASAAACWSTGSLSLPP